MAIQPFGTAITWTAAAAGDVPPMQYRFEREDGATWSTVQDYSPANSYSWTPSASDVGDHAVRVSVRNAGSVADFEDTRILTMTVNGGSGLLSSPSSTPAVRFPLRPWMPHRRRDEQPPVALSVRATFTDTANGDMKRYSIYTPELNLLTETESTTSTVPAPAYDYVWFGGQPVAQIDDATNATHYYFDDHLGTPILTTDSSATVDWRAEREPFGSIVSLRAGAERHQPLSFPGQEEGDRSYNVFRWYRAGWGRYTQSDPIGTVFFDVPNRDARNTHLNHLYAYGDGNPETNADPLGLVSCCNKAFDDCFGKCIENWRLDYKTPPLFSAVPKRFFPPFRVPYPEQPLTNVLSVVGRFMGGRSTAVGSAMRGAGRIISPVATTLTVFEGFYDLTVIGECATACKLNPCTDLAWAW